MTQNSINNTASSMDISNINIDGNTISTTDTNGNLILAPDGSGEVSVTAAPVVPSTDREDSLGSSTNSWNNVYANGLTFDDGNNILSTYTDQATWTPTLRFGESTRGIQYRVQSGVYTRIGNIVFINIRIYLDSKGTATGQAFISGLPVNVAAEIPAVASSSWDFITFSNGYNSVRAAFLDNTSEMFIDQVGNNVVTTHLTNTNFANNTEIDITGFYFV